MTLHPVAFFLQGRIKWEQNKEYLRKKKYNDPEIQEIVSLLTSARSEVPSDIHPYDVHARILNDLWQGKEDSERFNLINKAADIINEGLKYCADDPSGTERLRALLIESLSEIDPASAELKSFELLCNEGDGSGFYTLALLAATNQKDDERVLFLLDKALSASKYPASSITMKISVLLNSNSPDYKELLKLANDLSNRTNITDYSDNWESAYYKAIIYLINDQYETAVQYFSFSNRKSPRFLERLVRHFWMAGGRRRVFSGKIGRTMTVREGRIYHHKIQGWQDDIYFAPHRQEKKTLFAAWTICRI